MSERPQELVRRGYDRVSRAYRDDTGSLDGDAQRLLQRVLTGVPAGAQVLDLGCGAGVPFTRLLAERFEVLGVDISAVQVGRARALVPAARFLEADMCAVDFADGAFAAVVMLYSLIHVPLEEQWALLARIWRWLLPDGILLCTVGWRAWTGTEDDWLVRGTTMYWSHADEATYRRRLVELGFAIEAATFLPEGASGHVLLAARRRGAHSTR